ncbi:hypothetical protein RHS03_07987, partial [Rhizoctonia solani]
MSTFYRFLCFAVVLVSFSLLVSALPSPRTDNAWLIASNDPLCTCINEFMAKAKACIDVIAGCRDPITLKANIAVFVALCNAHAAQLLTIGAAVKVTAESQASIVACYAAMITLLIQTCINLTVKLGVAVVVTACVGLDAAIVLVLKNLDICIKGVVVLIVNTCKNAVVGGFPQLNFNLCANLFVTVGA